MSQHDTTLLDRLAGTLPLHEDVATKVGFVLEAVQQATGADAVYWLPGATRVPPQAVGDLRRTPESCEQLLQQEMQHRPAAAALTCIGAGAEHYSAALVRVSQSRAAWLVALSFDPRRLLGAAETRLISLARRIFLQDRQRCRAEQKVKATLIGLIDCLNRVIIAKNPYTAHHSERVARIAARLAGEMGLGAQVHGDLYLTGLLHDIGKIGVSTSVLQHNGPLNASQRAEIERHPGIGDDILATVPSLQHLRPGVRHHHEHYDGSGYPDRLRGERIPLAARILAVADSCDAMFSPRPYRAGMPSERVDGLLTDGAGTQWDPVVVRAFLACRRELYTIYQKGVGASMHRAVSHLVRG